MKNVFLCFLLTAILFFAYNENAPLGSLFAPPKEEKNDSSFSEEAISFCFGVAENGKPHEISLSNQTYFDTFSNGTVLALDTKTKEKVLYLTFDSGYEYHDNTQETLRILNENHVDAAFFCTLSFLQKNPSLIRDMIESGHTIGNHSATHPAFPELSETEMQAEIDAVDRYLSENFSYNCRYFRFPSGIYSEKALYIAEKMGHRSIFWSIAYADWDTENQMPPEKAMETLLSRLHPGAVILLHSVSDTNLEILADFIDAAREKGYIFQSLDSYFKE